MASQLSVYVVVRSRRMEFVRGFGMMMVAGVLCAYHGAWYDGAVLTIPFGLAWMQGSRVLRLMTVRLLDQNR